MLVELIACECVCPTALHSCVSKFSTEAANGCMLLNLIYYYYYTLWQLIFNTLINTEFDVIVILLSFAIIIFYVYYTTPFILS